MAGINNTGFIVLLLFLVTGVLSAQNKKYIIYFKDKNNSPYSLSDPTAYLSAKAIQRRAQQQILITANDLPVNPFYIDSIILKGAQVIHALKWSNSVVVSASAAQLTSIASLPFVSNYKNIARQLIVENNLLKATSSKIETSTSTYGNSYTQVHMLEVDEMHKEGFRGEGMLIALLDAGFQNASSVNFLAHLYTNNRVLATYDFVDHETNVYNDNDHGLLALSAVAGYQDGVLIGTAYNASYVLLRTEDAISEYEMEEAYWAKGAEYADSIGVDIISSSLGYSTFDNGINHSFDDLNGNTTIAAIAADMAASKGIVVICSAGNEGSTGWHSILTPADGDSVLAIGAVDLNGTYASFSSVGPSADGRIKPDLAAMGKEVTLGAASGSIVKNNGTSFSCPLVAGLAAGLWQAFPLLTNMQLVEVLKKSASHYSNPDSYLGYGIPGYIKSKNYIADTTTILNFNIFPNPISEGFISFAAEPEYINQSVSIKMYDRIGRLVAEDTIQIKNMKNETNINLSFFPAGLYSMHFAFSDKTEKAKLVKF